MKHSFQVSMAREPDKEVLWLVPDHRCRRIINAEVHQQVLTDHRRRDRRPGARDDSDKGKA
jgi:hypothetical protein